MKTYELVVLLHPDLEIDVDTPIAKIEKLIESLNGKITRRDNWGKKRLAYRIKKLDFAIYVYFEVQLPGEQVRQLESTLLITEESLRHLIVSHEQESAKPTKKTKKEPAAVSASTGSNEEVSDGKEL